MEPAASAPVTQLLRAWTNGDERALTELTPLVYRELRRRAGKYMAQERPGNTLQATALVHEVYLRLVDASGVAWQDRAHFFAVASQMMRRILVDAARSRASGKRGGEVERISLDEGCMVDAERDHELLALNDAIDSLAKQDPRKAQVVELRFFGGLSVDETAEVLKTSADTVGRDWSFAKSWLKREIKGPDSTG
jgi:RNA polymerase sigma factor (TIGR02999 family)